MASSRRGHRTLVISFDLAHSLFDSFDLDRSLFDLNKGDPLQVAERLDVQEIDVQEELARYWGEVYKYMAMLLSSASVSDVVAEEVAILPGMEDVIAMMYLNQYLTAGTYDTIVVDCPPTSESLRFVNITSTIEWYMMKRFNIDRNLVKFAGPLVKRITDYQLPEDSYFTALKNIFEKVKGVDKILVDPEQTTVRLVTSAEKMVIRETQRAFMYFNLYGIVTDQVVINRMLPKTPDGYYARWVKAQAGYADEIREYFSPVPVSTLPLFPEEVIGLSRLQQVSDALYGKDDPTRFYLKATPYQFLKTGDEYVLQFDLPFVQKSEIDLVRQNDNLVIRIGTFKRHVQLPRAVVRRNVVGAQMTGIELKVRFGAEGL